MAPVPRYIVTCYMVSIEEEERKYLQFTPLALSVLIPHHFFKAAIISIITLVTPGDGLL